MVRTKQTSGRSNGRSAEENRRWEEERERRHLAERLAAKRRKYKTGCEAFWDVSEETLKAGLVFRGATMEQLAGAWEVFGYFYSAYDWDGDHNEFESVLVSAGRLYINDDGSGKVDVPPECCGRASLTGDFQVEITFGPGDVLRYADRKNRISSSFDFVGEAAPRMLRRDDRAMGDIAVDEETMAGYDNVVGTDYDYSNKMSGQLLNAPIPALGLLEGDMVLAEEHETWSTKFFARRADAPVPFPRADYVTVAEKDDRIRELEHKYECLQDQLADLSKASRAAKRART